MQTTRRGFLKGLMALTGAAVVGPIGIGTPTTPATQAALLDDVVETPITATDPLFWLEIDGQKYAALDASVSISMPKPLRFLANADTSPFYAQGPKTWEMDVTLADVTNFTMNASEFRLRMPDSGRCYSGRGYMGSLEQQFRYDGGDVLTYLTIVGDGELTVSLA